MMISIFLFTVDIAWTSLFAAVVDCFMICLLECMSSGSLVLWCLVAIHRMVLYMFVMWLLMIDVSFVYFRLLSTRNFVTTLAPFN